MSNAAPREVLETLLGHLGFVFQIEEIQQGDTLTLNVQTRDPGRLIGREGHTLHALQYLINRILYGSEESISTRVLIDIEGYLRKEQGDLIQRARQIATRVRETGAPETIGPLNSFDRRAVHQEFASDPHIMTRSEDTTARLKKITIQPRNRQ